MAASSSHRSLLDSKFDILCSKCGITPRSASKVGPTITLMNPTYELAIWVEFRSQRYEIGSSFDLSKSPSAKYSSKSKSTHFLHIFHSLLGFEISAMCINISYKLSLSSSSSSSLSRFENLFLNFVKSVKWREKSVDSTMAMILFRISLYESLE